MRALARLGCCLFLPTALLLTTRPARALVTRSRGREDRRTALSLAAEGETLSNQRYSLLKAVSAGAALVYVFQPSLVSKRPTLPSMTSAGVVGDMLKQSIVAHLLESASRRGRLDGNTFKTLNLGTLLGALACILELFSPYDRAAFTPAAMSLSALIATIPVAQECGPPRFNFELRNPLSLAFAVSSKHVGMYDLMAFVGTVHYRIFYFADGAKRKYSRTTAQHCNVLITQWCCGSGTPAPVLNDLQNNLPVCAY